MKNFHLIKGVNNIQKHAKKQLEKFRKTFERWRDEQEKEWERIDMDDDGLIGLACQIAADYYSKE